MLWEEDGQLMLAESREEMEDDVCERGGDGVLSLFQRTCKTAFSAGNSAMSIKLQRASPKSGSSYCTENSPSSSSFSRSSSFSCCTDSGVLASLTFRMSLGFM